MSAPRTGRLHCPWTSHCQHLSTQQVVCLLVEEYALFLPSLSSLGSCGHKGDASPQSVPAHGEQSGETTYNYLMQMVTSLAYTPSSPLQEGVELLTNPRLLCKPSGCQAIYCKQRRTFSGRFGGPFCETGRGVLGNPRGVTSSWVCAT